jgi:DNA-binding XRE family transcriptional regulator
MTGKEFAAAIKRAGYTQGRFAAIMGVHRTTIAARCEADQVEPYWVYALAGLIAGNTSLAVAEIVAHANIK